MGYAEGVAQLGSAARCVACVCQADTPRKGGLQSPNLSQHVMVRVWLLTGAAAEWEYSPPDSRSAPESSCMGQQLTMREARLTSFDME